MGEVAADTEPRGVDVGRRGPRAAPAVLERQVAVDVAADRLDPGVAGGHGAEARPGFVAERVRQAVAAGQGVDEHPVWQLFRRQLRRLFVGVLGRVGHKHQGAETQRGAPGGQHRPRTRVAVEVGVVADAHLWLRRPLPSPETDRGRVTGLDLENGRGVNGSHVHELASHPHPSHAHGPSVLLRCFSRAIRVPSSPSVRGACQRSRRRRGACQRSRRRSFSSDAGG